MTLSGSLAEIGLELGRLKTGTPPRLLRRSIDFSKTEVQPGDEPVPYFSFWKDELFHVEHSTADGRSLSHVEQSNPALPGGVGKGYPPGSILERIKGQLPCHVTYTTDSTASVIRKNL